MRKIREQLSKACENENFLKIVYESFLERNTRWQCIANEISNLHNEGEINVLAEFHKLTKDLEGIDFYICISVFELIIVELNPAVKSVMECIKHLLNQSNDSMTANQLFNTFIKFCEKDSHRAKEALDIALANTETWADFIAPALIAGTNRSLTEYTQAILEFLTNDKQEIRIGALIAIRKINFRNDISLIKNTLITIEKTINAVHGVHLCAFALDTVFSIYHQDKRTMNEVVHLTKTILTHTEDEILYKASEIFAFKSENLPKELIDILLSALREVKPHNKSSLENIDYGLQLLLKTNQEEIIISFLEDFLIKNNTSIDNFDNLIYDLLSNQQVLNQLVTRWLLSKKMVLLNALNTILQLSQNNDLILHADTDQLRAQPEGVYLFIARKAIGWLFNFPISAMSFIVSLIDTATNNENQQIAELLFYPLLINYPNKLIKYINLASTCHSPKINKILTKAVDELNKYYQNLHDINRIYELQPPLEQREIYSRFCSQQMTNMYKEALKTSIFYSTAHKSVLLYGRKSINYIDSPSKQTKRIEIPLENHSHTIELPNLECIDPHGLNYLLWQLRIDECEK
jgi:hypothetical protein